MASPHQLNKDGNLSVREGQPSQRAKRAWPSGLLNPRRVVQKAMPGKGKGLGKGGMAGFVSGNQGGKGKVAARSKSTSDSYSECSGEVSDEVVTISGESDVDKGFEKGTGKGFEKGTGKGFEKGTGLEKATGKNKAQGLVDDQIQKDDEGSFEESEGQADSQESDSETPIDWRAFLRQRAKGYGSKAKIMAMRAKVMAKAKPAAKVMA